MNFLYWYMSVGLSVYSIFFIKDAVSGFTKYGDGYGYPSFMRGFFGAIFVWPMLLWMMEIE